MRFGPKVIRKLKCFFKRCQWQLRFDEHRYNTEIVCMWCLRKKYHNDLYGNKK